MNTLIKFLLGFLTVPLLILASYGLITGPKWLFMTVEIPLLLTVCTLMGLMAIGKE